MPTLANLVPTPAAKGALPGAPAPAGQPNGLDAGLFAAALAALTPDKPQQQAPGQPAAAQPDPAGAGLPTPALVPAAKVDAKEPNRHETVPVPSGQPSMVIPSLPVPATLPPQPAAGHDASGAGNAIAVMTAAFVSPGLPLGMPFARDAAPGIAATTAKEPPQAGPPTAPVPRSADSTRTAPAQSGAPAPASALPQAETATPAAQRPAAVFATGQPTAAAAQAPAKPKDQPASTAAPLPPAAAVLPAIPHTGAPAAATTQAPAAPQATAPAPFTAQLAKPVFTLAAAGHGEHIMTVKVTPEDLGPVTVQAHISADGVKVQLFAPTDAGRAAVQAALPELRQDLSNSGLNASLDLSSRSQPQAGGGQPGPGGQPPAPRGTAVEAEPAQNTWKPAPVTPTATDTRLDILA